MAASLSWDPEGDLRLLDALLNGIHGMRPLSVQEKIAWMRHCMPRTYGLLAVGRHWALLTDKVEEVR